MSSQMGHWGHLGRAVWVTRINGTASVYSLIYKLHTGTASPRPPAIGTVKNAHDHQPRDSTVERTIRHCSFDNCGVRESTKPADRFGEPTIASE